MGARDVEDLFGRANARHPDVSSLIRAVGPEPSALACRPLGAGDPLVRMAWLDWAGRLPESILVKVDRASMGAGLEVRSPLLDSRIVRFCARLPVNAKVAGRQRKWLLRRVLEQQLPVPFEVGPKRGFGVPIGAWLRGPLRAWAQDVFASPALSCEGLIDPLAARKALHDHLSGRRNQPHLLWTLLMLLAWRERWQL